MMQNTIFYLFFNFKDILTFCLKIIFKEKNNPKKLVNIDDFLTKTLFSKFAIFSLCHFFSSKIPENYQPVYEKQHINLERPYTICTITTMY